MQFLRAADLVDVPWKNGGGITRNIALATCDDQMAWRLSRADVAQDGAFSHFVGLERILTVVSHTGMVLDHPHGTIDAAPWQPVRFAGDLAVFSRLKDGPLTDLNLMFDPRLCAGSVTTLRGPHESAFRVLKHGLRALHVLAGQPAIDGQSFEVGDTVFLEATTPLRLGKEAAVLDIALRYLDHSKPVTFAIAAR